MTEYLSAATKNVHGKRGWLLTTKILLKMIIKESFWNRHTHTHMYVDMQYLFFKERNKEQFFMTIISFERCTVNNIHQHMDIHISCILCRCGVLSFPYNFSWKSITLCIVLAKIYRCVYKKHFAFRIVNYELYFHIQVKCEAIFCVTSYQKEIIPFHQQISSLYVI